MNCRLPRRPRGTQVDRRRRHDQDRRHAGTPDAQTIYEFELYERECMDIPPGLVHQMEALEDSELYEFSTQHFESDSYRLVKGD